MKIESIKQGRRDRDKLVIRTECGSYISARVDDAYTLRVGDEISCEEAAELEAKFNAEAVKKSAAKILAHHSISKEELKNKLRGKGFSDKSSTETAEWFSERGMVDDAAFARQIAEYYKGRGCGEIKIRQEMLRRGIE
ncbi:MAG: RecX family transcriptional regulator, partial [Oscillospiraceae bacterium]|nr:RecX family transcriptional regulator [Oscillospiraceae bacterium]